jgi:predicted secreted protein
MAGNVHTGSEGTIKVGTDTVGELRSYSLETTGATIESTNMGTIARTYKAGLTSWTGTASLYWDELDAGQTALVVGSEITIKVYPEGASTGDKYYTGTAIVTAKSVSASFDGLVESSISFTGNGALTLSTAT